MPLHTPACPPPKRYTSATSATPLLQPAVSRPALPALLSAASPLSPRLSEDAIRKNVVLVYELLDEVVDYGFPQSTATEALKQFVVNEPVVVAPVSYQVGKRAVGA
jgi:hypothetical protein